MFCFLIFAVCMCQIFNELKLCGCCEESGGGAHNVSHYNICLVPQRTQNLINAVLAAIHSPCSMGVTTTWGANNVTESEMRIYKTQHVVNYSTARSLISLFSFQSIKVQGKFSIQTMRAYDRVNRSSTHS